MCIIIICFPVYDVIIFEFSLSVLVKPFSAWPKALGQKFEYLKYENTTLKVSVFSPSVGSMDQKNSEYRHLLRSDRAFKLK